MTISRTTAPKRPGKTTRKRTKPEDFEAMLAREILAQRPHFAASGLQGLYVQSLHAACKRAGLSARAIGRYEEAGVLVLTDLPPVLSALETGRGVQRVRVYEVRPTPSLSRRLDRQNAAPDRGTLGLPARAPHPAPERPAPSASWTPESSWAEMDALVAQMKREDAPEATPRHLVVVPAPRHAPLTKERLVRLAESRQGAWNAARAKLAALQSILTGAEQLPSGAQELVDLAAVRAELSRTMDALSGQTDPMLSVKAVEPVLDELNEILSWLDDETP